MAFALTILYIPAWESSRENKKQRTKDNHLSLDSYGAFVRFLDQTFEKTVIYFLKKVLRENSSFKNLSVN